MVEASALPCARPALLASIHDVSPLTLEAAQAAHALLTSSGISTADLTILVIPFHNGQVPLYEDAATVRWIRGLADAGATIAMHGLTHRMPSPSRGPAAWVWAYGL